MNKQEIKHIILKELALILENYRVVDLYTDFVSYSKYSSLEKHKKVVPKVRDIIKYWVNKVKGSFKLNINKIYLIDFWSKESIGAIPDSTVGQFIKSYSIRALYDPKKEDIYISPSEILGEDFPLLHELGHAIYHQNKKLLTNSVLIDAFKKDKDNWKKFEPRGGITIGSEEKEFICDFLATFIEDKGEAQRYYPNYYQAFIKIF